MTELMIRINISREMGWLETSDLKNYDLIIPSHILEGMTKRITSMIAKLKKPYVIDPRTYVFGADVKHIQERRWFDKLLGNYGLDTMVKDPRNFVLPSSSLIDENQQSTNNLKELVKNVTNYQRTKIQETYNDINEFEEFDEEPNENLNFKPKWIIPPYFFINVSREDWLAVNINSIKLAIENKKPDEKIFAVIMIAKEMLPHTNEVDEIVNKYDIEGVDGYMIWCADINENTDKERDLKYFQKFITKLANYKKPIHNMYGGLFSLLLEGKGMTGTCHSICYGEHKNPFLTGGRGGSITRFYQPHLYAKIPLARTEEVEKALELDECDCQYCITLKNKNTKGGELELAGKHFLLKRKAELEEINSKGTELFLEKLTTASEMAKEKDETGAYSNFYERFSVWNKVLND